MKAVFDWFLERLRRSLDRLAVAGAAQRIAEFDATAESLLDEYLAKLPADRRAEVEAILKEMKSDFFDDSSNGSASMPGLTDPKSPALPPSNPTGLPIKRGRGRPPKIRPTKDDAQ